MKPSYCNNPKLRKATMADIPQWRRRIPPSRSRTPLPDFAEADNETRPPSALAGPSTRPATPKKGLRPKLSSYLSQSGPFSTTSKPEPEPVFAELPVHRFPSWVIGDPFPNPSAEQLIDAIMCRLMSQPYDALEPRFNSALLQIFEAFRDLTDMRDRLRETLASETRGRLAEQAASRKSQSKWDEEKQTYKAEVKRLELIIAKGKRGVADVALARQDSLIRRRRNTASPDDVDDGKETVFEFLEKTRRVEDRSWSGQRGTVGLRNVNVLASLIEIATMKNRPASPSMKMANLSKKLTKKTSKTSILAELPFGSPPPNLPSTSVLQASYLEDQARMLEPKEAENRTKSSPDIRASFSDDTTSTFSCAGDLLPDEGNDKANRIGTVPVGVENDSDLADIRRIATTISRRKGVSVESVMPRLTDLLRLHSPTDEQSPQHQSGEHVQRMVTAPTVRTGNTTVIRKSSHLKGFFNKLKPQLSFEPQSEPRRFSFEVGDDVGPIDTHLQGTSSRESLLRKSASLSSLPAIANRGPTANAPANLSPINSSPTTSTRTADSRQSSKIPSPVFINGTLAKPRQERDSLVAHTPSSVEGSEHVQRSSSLASSAYSAQSLHLGPSAEVSNALRLATLIVTERTASRLELDKTSHRAGLSSHQPAESTSRPITDQTNAVRAGTPRAGCNAAARNSGSARVSSMPSTNTYSPTRGVFQNRSSSSGNASVHPSLATSEMVRPPVRPSRHNGDVGGSF